jgi:DNA-binding YbaB/EbfC family protein
MSGFNLQELMSQAKQQYETLQKKMEQTVVEASAGGGSVTVKMDGRKQVLAIKIDPEAVKAGDVEMLQDLVMAASTKPAAKSIRQCNRALAECSADWEGFCNLVIG